LPDEHSLEQAASVEERLRITTLPVPVVPLDSVYRLWQQHASLLWHAPAGWQAVAAGVAATLTSDGPRRFAYLHRASFQLLRALSPDYSDAPAPRLWGGFAFASGGMVGTGLGLGSPTLIPYVGSDFILAAFGEELGMLGVSAVLLCYLVLVGRGLRIAVERADSFEKLLAVGLTTLLGLQVFVIAGGVLRLIPLTGVPLPLMSYGGTSRVATSVMLALLVRTSAGPWYRTRRRAKRLSAAEADA